MPVSNPNSAGPIGVKCYVPPHIRQRQADSAPLPATRPCNVPRAWANNDWRKTVGPPAPTTPPQPIPSVETPAIPTVAASSGATPCPDPQPEVASSQPLPTKPNEEAATTQPLPNSLPVLQIQWVAKDEVPEARRAGGAASSLLSTAFATSTQSRGGCEFTPELAEVNALYFINNSVPKDSILGQNLAARKCEGAVGHPALLLSLKPSALAVVVLCTSLNNTLLMKKYPTAWRGRRRYRVIDAGNAYHHDNFPALDVAPNSDALEKTTHVNLEQVFSTELDSLSPLWIGCRVARVAVSEDSVASVFGERPGEFKFCNSIWCLGFDVRSRWTSLSGFLANFAVVRIFIVGDWRNGFGSEPFSSVINLLFTAYVCIILVRRNLCVGLSFVTAYGLVDSMYACWTS
ncbi:hypothetical protein M501DRAFT_1014726 [Patellaria atrata CBS 101060]|uniref:Uncharacterized protein n=1 Tax=Patellaria atrata CBS 101060 TaxID=1346257 RepID=A0A9P4SDG6_9PEZI|nr:hypothetical protein M501DRAFT_1014726 [Patellaria atrata CBS 101060]